MPAFKFRPYITDALISLENQTLNKTYFEVIVVKNFTGEDNIFLKYSLNLLVIHSSSAKCSRNMAMFHFITITIDS
jgi:hypothetical protein